MYFGRITHLSCAIENRGEYYRGTPPLSSALAQNQPHWWRVGGNVMYMQNNVEETEVNITRATYSSLKKFWLDPTLNSDWMSR